MKYGLIVSALLVAAIAGCSRHDGSPFPLEKLQVVNAVNPGELVAGLPLDLSGKSVSSYETASVDQVNNKQMDKDLRWYLKHGDSATIAGWTFVKPESGVHGATYIELANADGRYYAIVDTHVPRSDVAKAYNLANDQVGYELTIHTDRMAPGAYHIGVLQQYESGIFRWESPARIIVD